MPEKDISYKTSDILSLYGLSNKGLFYYEEKGLISPRRTEAGNYRVYSLQETARLHECRLYRGFGFSVEESISLVTHVSPDELTRSYAERKKAIQYDILWSQLVMERLELDAEAIRAIEANTEPWELIPRPAMLRIPLRDVHSPYTQQSEESYLQWQDFLPVANASLLYPEPAVEGEELPVNLGFIMGAEIPARLGIDVPHGSSFLPPVPCLHTFISGPNDRLNLRSRIAPVLARMAKQGLLVGGPPVTRMIASFDNGSGMQRYDNIWIPVTETGRG